MEIESQRLYEAPEEASWQARRAIDSYDKGDTEDAMTRAALSIAASLIAREQAPTIEEEKVMVTCAVATGLLANPTFAHIDAGRLTDLIALYRGAVLASLDD